MAKRTNKNTVVGIEIEPSGIHAAAVTVNGSIRLAHAHTVQLEPGIVRDGEVADPEGLANAMRTLFADHKELDKRVRIGVANQKIVVRILQLPVIADHKEFEAAVRFSAQDEIPMPLESAILDFHPLDVVDTPEGPRQRVLLVAARRDMVAQVLNAARAAGLRPEGIDLAAFGMIRALHHGDEEGDGHVLYLSVGGLTNLAVAHGSVCLFTRVVGGGLEAIAVELAERKQLTLEHARAWLEHVGLETPLGDIEGDASIIEEARAVLLDGTRRIAGDVRNSLDFHNAATTTGASVSRVVLTGAAAGVPGFAEALSSELGLPVAVGTVSGLEGVNAGRLTVAAGLAVEEAPAS
ncbi:MAG: type pilus assembly protein PilM [Frankiaceae bacterium]|nr:type pilus assembly protein PilM [Frankiaceae bacterium]